MGKVVRKRKVVEEKQQREKEKSCISFESIHIQFLYRELKVAKKKKKKKENKI